MDVLQARELRKNYRGQWAVDGVSLRIETGQVVGLLGPNGAGKTTCFQLITGMERPDAGRILLGEKDITALPMHRRARKGIIYLPQEPSVFRRLSVRDNLLAVLETRRGLGRAQREQRARELLRDFALEEKAELRAGVLSGGERRRTELARALALEPRFLLLDEPFAGVDPIAVEEIKRLVGGLRRRKIGVLLTDHNVREALDLCDYACILRAGSLLAAGAPAQVIDNPRVRETYLGERFRAV